MATGDDTQRIARLTPVAEVLACIDALVRPVAPRPEDPVSAVGRVLAEDVIAPSGLPTAARALRDGYAVSAESIADASAYAPVALPTPPVRVDVGDVLPPGTDAVAPLDSVVDRGGRLEAIAPVAPGEGVLAASADVEPGAVLCRAGRPLRKTDVAALAAAGIASVMVRVPRIRVETRLQHQDPIIESAIAVIRRTIADEGLASERSEFQASAIVRIGGTGSGRRDASVQELVREGRVEVHGIAISPGETAAFGVLGDLPVLLLPGRLDAVLAVWLVIGRHLLARLSGRTEEPPAMRAALARKVASPLGLTEVVPVRLREGKAEPIASGYWPLVVIAQADGWILVPAESEGYPAGTEVVIRPWP